MDATKALILDLGGLDSLADQVSDTGCYSIRLDKVDHITDGVMRLIGDLVATLIDAGSEREAVEENETMRDAIRDELMGWI